MGVYKMSTINEFVIQKFYYDPKKDPVWVYLEAEMIANVEKKPYNEKVGSWLKYLKDLRHYRHCEEKIAMQKLENEVGPPWYIELSIEQRTVLQCLKNHIKQDLLEDFPCRVRRALSDLGINLKFKKKMLLRAMRDSEEDPGIFMWYLYTEYYKVTPNILRTSYSIDAMLMMSSMVFIDLEECISRMSALVKLKKPPPPTTPLKAPKKNTMPNIRYGAYLQKNYAKCYCNHPSGDEEKPKHPELDYKIKILSEKNYELLRDDLSFLQRRKDRNKKTQAEERICNYKFWQPPGVRNTDRQSAAATTKIKMLSLRAEQKHKAPYKNVDYLVSGVSFTRGKPNYILSNNVIKQTGFIPINGGISMVGNAYVTAVNGYWRCSKAGIEDCESSCDCLEKWEKPVMEYLKESKCKCGHLYDYYREGKVKEKYFIPPTPHGPYTLDKAKIFQMDPMEDFIKKKVKEALQSGEATPEPSEEFLAAGKTLSDLLAAVLADLSDSPMIIPHLPKACMLNNLQEWIRKRVRGPLTAKDHKQMNLHSLRRWLYLKHTDFRARAGRIPFTMEQLEHMDWSYRKQLQVLFLKLLDDFKTRNQIKQVQQTRLWWSTMKYDAYPSKAFLEIYFTYMPARLKDSFLVNPYSSELTPKHGAKTCPLDPS